MSKINWPLLREACAIIDGIPDSRFDLGLICNNEKNHSQRTNPHHCGTVGCAMGWLGMHPKFNKLGLTVEDGGELCWKGDFAFYDEAGSYLFGMTGQDANYLFATPGHSPLDKCVSNLDHDKSKQIFRKRIRKFFKKHGQPCAW